MPSRRQGVASNEQLGVVKRGQLLGFGALAMMLTAIVVLAGIGQSWVAGTLATAGMAVVAAFVTGRYQPSPVHTREDMPACPIGCLRQRCWARAPL